MELFGTALLFGCLAQASEAFCDVMFVSEQHRVNYVPVMCYLSLVKEKVLSSACRK